MSCALCVRQPRFFLVTGFLWPLRLFSLENVGVKNAFLFEVVRHRVLSQKRCLQTNLGAYPLASAVLCVRRMIASPTAPKLWSKFCALNLLELLDVVPGGISDCTGNVDLKSHHCHLLIQSTSHWKLYKMNDRRGLAIG